MSETMTRTDTESRQELRQALTTTIAAWMKESGLEGSSAEDAAREEFIGVPAYVIVDAVMMLDEEKEEIWWRQFERTRLADLLRQELIEQRGDVEMDGDAEIPL
ncbi:MAG: hypothetical protein R3D70_12210 [Rhizobiaceae bacterium]